MGQPRTKTDLAEKDVKSNGQPRPPGFNSLKVLVMMTSVQNIVILGAQGLLILMGSKFLIKMTRPQNIKTKNSVLHLFPGMFSLLIPQG